MEQAVKAVWKRRGDTPLGFWAGGFVSHARGHMTKNDATDGNMDYE